MTRDWNPSGPPPELLAAYADGALTGADRDRVASWLVDHPEARLEVLELQRLQNLMEQSQPQDPKASAWAGVLERVHSALKAPPRPKPAPRWPAGVYQGAAAAALLCLIFGWAMMRRSDNHINNGPDTAALLAEFEQRIAILERRASSSERSAADASRRADEATSRARQAEERVKAAEQREATALDMASTPHLDLLSHDQVRMLTPSPKIQLTDWSTPMVVDPVLNVRGP